MAKFRPSQVYEALKRALTPQSQTAKPAVQGKIWSGPWVFEPFDPAEKKPATEESEDHRIENYFGAVADLTRSECGAVLDAMELTKSLVAIAIESNGNGTINGNIIDERVRSLEEKHERRGPINTNSFSEKTQKFVVDYLMQSRRAEELELGALKTLYHSILAGRPTAKYQPTAKPIASL